MRTRFARAVAPVALLGLLATGGAAVAAKGDHVVIVPGKPSKPAAPEIRSGVLTVPTITDSGKKSKLPVYWAAPKRPRALVVVFHGHGHNGEEWAPQLRTIAKRDRALAVAMHTRETKASKGPFNSVDEEARGAAAVIAKIRKTVNRPLPTYLLCVSMGCTGAGYLIDAATRPTGGDTDAKWIQKRFTGRIAGLVVAEGLSNLVETWAEAAAADQTAQKEIEYETRTAAGPATPAQNPIGYRSRSLALLPRTAYADFGLASAAVIHPLNDGLVPVNQGVETRLALAKAGVPFAGFTVIGNGPTCHTADQTTGTSHASAALDSRLCLAGHASETKPKTPVMRVAHDVLHRMISGGVGTGEHTVDPDMGANLSR